MEHPGINGCCQQVIGCCDGMNVTSQVKVKLKGKKDEDEIGHKKSRNKSSDVVVHIMDLFGPVENKISNNGVKWLYLQNLVSYDKHGKSWLYDIQYSFSHSP